jgi:hypothetical protein
VWVAALVLAVMAGFRVATAAMDRGGTIQTAKHLLVLK